MDPHSFIARAEAQRWLGIAEKLLMGHDFVGAKTFAIRAREADPRLESADQILAIADTLLAAEKRVVRNNGAQQPDFYAILQLVRFVQDTEHIASQYRRLAVMLNPHQNRFPFTDQAFQVVNEAYGVLSNPFRKSMYDAELDFPQQQQQQQQMNHIGFNLEQHHHQQHHHQQHNFLSQPNSVRPVPVREQEQLFQQPSVQSFQITSMPHQQSRPSPQPHPQLQLPMRQPTPPSPAAAPPQPRLSWLQAPPPSPSLPPQPHATTPSQPPLPWSQAPPPSSPLPPQPHATTPPQPPLSWPHAPPPSQPPPPPPQVQPQQQMPLQPVPQPQTPPPPQPQPQTPPPPPQPQPQPQPQTPPPPPPQAAAPPPLQPQAPQPQPLQPQRQSTKEASENVDESPTFWTACPYCLYMFEYPRVYADCALRCDNCKRAFQAVRVPSPPQITEGQEAYFCCWGSFPLGVSISHLENNNGTGTNSNWTPFSPFCDVSRNVKDNLNGNVATKTKRLGPRIYVDDVNDDIFTGISKYSDDCDVEWGSTKKKKAKRMKKDLGKKKKTVENLRNSITVQEGERASIVPLSKSSKKPRRQSDGVTQKELGKLDLNVEFNNNEGEEAAPRMAAENRGNGQGEEDKIEGSGFFEGLDEFFSSLPILNVVNDEKGGKDA